MLALIVRTPITDKAHSPDLRSAQVFSFITLEEPGTQHGLRLYDPESESPLTFRKGDTVALNGHTDEDGILQLTGYHRSGIHPAEEFTIRELVKNEFQVAAAIDSEFASDYGHPDGRLTLWEGPRANLITFNRGNRHCTLHSHELKDGTTEDSLRERLLDALENDGDLRETELDTYHRAYPTQMVEFRARRFPAHAVRDACAGHTSTPADTGRRGSLEQGSIADILLDAAGAPAHGLRVQSVHGHTPEGEETFWRNLASILGTNHTGAPTQSAHAGEDLPHGLVISQDQMAIAIETEFVSQYGDPAHRQWLFEGRWANAVMSDQGHQSDVVDYELKPGCSQEQLFIRLQEARHRPSYQNQIDLENHIRDYPTEVVAFDARRFPLTWVHQACEMYDIRPSDTSTETVLTGNLAEIIVTDAGGEGHGVRVQHVNPTQGHTASDFWARLWGLSRR